MSACMPYVVIIRLNHVRQLHHHTQGTLAQAFLAADIYITSPIVTMHPATAWLGCNVLSFVLTCIRVGCAALIHVCTIK
jgi:hypothetical protein